MGLFRKYGNTEGEQVSQSPNFNMSNRSTRPVTLFFLTDEYFEEYKESRQDLVSFIGTLSYEDLSWLVQLNLSFFGHDLVQEDILGDKEGMEKRHPYLRPLNLEHMGITATESVKASLTETLKASVVDYLNQPGDGLPSDGRFEIERERNTMVVSLDRGVLAGNNDSRRKLRRSLIQSLYDFMGEEVVHGLGLYKEYISLVQ